MSEFFANRIKWLINDKTDGNVSKFAILTNNHPSSVKSVLSRKSKSPSIVMVYRIKDKFPDVNLDWLVLGKGEPYVRNINLNLSYLSSEEKSRYLNDEFTLSDVEHLIDRLYFEKRLETGTKELLEGIVANLEGKLNDLMVKKE